VSIEIEEGVHVWPSVLECLPRVVHLQVRISGTDLQETTVFWTKVRRRGLPVF
jgi:hypothetical protein